MNEIVNSGTQGDSGDNSSSVVGPQTATAAQAKPPDTKRTAPKNKCRWTQDPLMAALTAAGLIALIVYTAYTRQLVIDTKFATGEQARLTTDSNRINLEAYTAVQRAFITISDVEINPIYDNGEITHWALRINIENSGSTPSVDLNVVPTNTDFPVGPQEGWSKIYPSVRLPNVPNDPEDARSILQRGGISLRALIGPHAKYPIISFGLPAAEGAPHGITAILAGKMRAFTYGAIHYHDIFKGTPEHVTKYCFGIGAEKTRDGIRPQSYPCAHWNCADEECQGDKRSYEAEVIKAFQDVGAEVPLEFYPPKTE